MLNNSHKTIASSKVKWTANHVNTGGSYERETSNCGRFVDARLLEELIAQWRKSAQNVSIWNAETLADGIEACADELSDLIPK